MHGHFFLLAKSRAFSPLFSCARQLSRPLFSDLRAPSPVSPTVVASLEIYGCWSFFDFRLNGAGRGGGFPCTPKIERHLLPPVHKIPQETRGPARTVCLGCAMKREEPDNYLHVVGLGASVPVPSALLGKVLGFPEQWHLRQGCVWVCSPRRF